MLFGVHSTNTARSIEFFDIAAIQLLLLIISWVSRAALVSGAQVALLMSPGAWAPVSVSVVVMQEHCSHGTRLTRFRQQP